jgi:hypothetical protein
VLDAPDHHDGRHQAPARRNQNNDHDGADGQGGLMPARIGKLQQQLDKRIGDEHHSGGKPAPHGDGAQARRRCGAAQQPAAPSQRQAENVDHERAQGRADGDDDGGKPPVEQVGRCRAKNERNGGARNAAEDRKRQEGAAGIAHDPLDRVAGREPYGAPQGGARHGLGALGSIGHGSARDGQAPDGCMPRFVQPHFKAQPQD